MMEKAILIKKACKIGENVTDLVLGKGDEKLDCRVNYLKLCKSTL